MCQEDSQADAKIRVKPSHPVPLSSRRMDEPHLSGSGGEGEGSEGDVGSEGTSQSHPDEQTPDDDYLSKFRQQEREERQEIEAELRQATTGLFGSQRGGGSPLGLPLLPGMRGPPRVPFLPVGTPPPPSSTASSPTESTTPSQSAWSFEEQFKQLYELNDDAKRKEFLDDLFSFMQKRGTPINRLPIMAKQVLDLYELFNLVIARGGLVEVINKKLWQEVIKGLNLPSSITSAAFTLRTQYMKYLYPFECYKERLSTPEELQAAIDGNRREGRRSSYTAFGEMTSHARSGSLSHQQMSPLSLVRPSMNGSSSSHPLAPVMLPDVGGLPPTTTSALLDMQARLNLWNKLVDQVGGGRGDIPPTFFPPPQHEALNLAATGGGGAVKREDGQNQNSPSPPSKKRHLDEKSHGDNLSPITGTHIKITSRGDGRGGVDNSLVVSMEINGVIYQGVLFAQGSSRDRIL